MQLNPVRKIKPSSRSVTGKHSSKKTCSVHYFESSLERDLLILLEWDENVVDFVAQPVSIKYIHEGRSKKYTPDVLVFYKSGLNRQPSLCEIKYSEELHDKADELKSKFDAAHQYSLLNGYQFKVLTEKEIRTDRLTNIKFLSSYSSGTVDNRYEAFIYEELNQMSFVTAGGLANDLNAKAFDRTLGLYTLWQLIAQGKLMVEIEEEITMNSKVWRK